MTRPFLIAGLLAATATPLLAQTAAPIPPAPPLAPMAPMTDRVVTRAELDAKVRTHFARVDANRDGFVTAEEMTARRGQMRQHRVVTREQRGDGQGARNPAAAFDRIDANRDGMISRDEFAKGRQLRIEKRVMVGGTPGQPGAMRMQGMRGGMMGGMMLKMADANKDGRVSLAEATSGALQHFDMMDSNRDGRLTPDERRAGRQMMRQGRTAG